VNLDTGAVSELDARWHRAHDLGPVLAATFANSPFDWQGRRTGRRSERLRTWSGIDPCRTAPARRGVLGAPESWARYALDAPVMMIQADGGCVALTDPLPFGQWLDQGHALGWPTLADFELHLTTLFPPVRPRGHLELRAIDALPDEWWPVAVAVTTVLIDDPVAAAVADATVPPVRDRWSHAIDDGLHDPPLRIAAERCFATALEALPRAGVGRDVEDAAARFHDRFVARGRCPADDLLDDWVRLPSTVS
jgi:glutamate--cysteine ligase